MRPPIIPPGREASYTFYAVRNEVSELERYAHGTVFSAITTAAFSGIKKPVPTAELKQRSDNLVEGFLRRMLENRQKN